MGKVVFTLVDSYRFIIYRSTREIDTCLLANFKGVAKGVASASRAGINIVEFGYFWKIGF